MSTVPVSQDPPQRQGAVVVQNVVGQKRIALGKVATIEADAWSLGWSAGIAAWKRHSLYAWLVD